VVALYEHPCPESKMLRFFCCNLQVGVEKKKKKKKKKKKRSSTMKRREKSLDLDIV
jgi:hypothetical protein